jgi:hypothetical protein
MLRSLSHGTIVVALALMWLAAGWVACDVLFADPALLIFEDVAILCAALAPVVYLIGWALRWFGLRLGDGAGSRA